MTRLVWDKPGSRTYETGVDRGVLYPIGSTGVPWNGLTTVTESPSGAEASAQYADDIKYLNLLSTEEFGGTIEAFTSPVEFDECDGSASPVFGIRIGQQTRKQFHLSYRTIIGNDIAGNEFGYKIHLVYNALAAPAERGYSTVNDSPEAISLSWGFSTTPIESSFTPKPTSHIFIDSTQVDADLLAALEDILYGSDTTAPRIPLPEELGFIVAKGGAVLVEDLSDGGTFTGSGFSEDSNDAGIYSIVSPHIHEDPADAGTYLIGG